MLTLLHLIGLEGAVKLSGEKQNKTASMLSHRQRNKGRGQERLLMYKQIESVTGKERVFC